MKYPANLLATSQKAIRAYDLLSDDILGKSRALLDTFSINIKEDFLEYQQGVLSRSQQVIAEFRRQQLYHFDVFRKAGFVANENNFSDAIASILDPHESHQLGKKPIMQLLDQMASYHSDKIDAVKKLIADERTNFVVRREKKLFSSRPDIEILGLEFIIFIENKVEGGAEHCIDGKPQTTRHWKGILYECQRRGISEDNALAIYLTPKGEPAIDKHFIPLSVPDLISAFRKAIASTDTGAKQSLLTFLDYYQFA